MISLSIESISGLPFTHLNNGRIGRIIDMEPWTVRTRSTLSFVVSKIIRILSLRFGLLPYEPEIVDFCIP